MSDVKRTPETMAARIAVRLPGGTTALLPVVRRVFAPLLGAGVPFSFGGKPMLDRDGESCFAEYAIMRDQQAIGRDAVWTSSYGDFRCFQTMLDSWRAKSDTTIPTHLMVLLRAIWQAGDTKACPDVLAWRGEQFLFCEAKRRGKDRLTRGQFRFIEAALNLGISPECFLIVEWTGIDISGLADLEAAPGISHETAQWVYAHFHPGVRMEG
jgi:hypothetical protein